LTGLVVDRTGHFWWAFFLAAVVVLIGGASWIFLTGPLVPVKWPREIPVGDEPLAVAPSPT
jgi:hypothetical protein